VREKNDAAATASPKKHQVSDATKDEPFVNSLGMEYVPVPGTKVLFCRTDTRVRDFRAYAEAAGYRQTGGAYVVDEKTGSFKLDEKASWEQPGFSQTGDHPVVCVSWEEAGAFCAWLSKKEGRTYRLPTDAEWSAGVGPGKYPWGEIWPPPAGVGNYCGEETKAGMPATWTVIEGYNDGYARTSPVGKFRENRHGLYDMGGNVRQWCEDEYKASMNDAETLAAYPALKTERYSDGTAFRVVRGASWYGAAEFALRSSYRNGAHPTYRFGNYGFRCVLEVSGG
jgi:formylglycine-generating enzyme required for sulfatase activity